MNSFHLLATGAASLLIAASGFAGTYKLDESHSQLGFKIRHLGISNVAGHFKKFEGRGKFDEKTGKISELKVTINASSIDTNDVKRDKHLRSDDFFSTKEFPRLQFVSTKVDYSRGKPARIHGNLTIRGITKKVKLKVEEWGGTVTDPWGNRRVAFQAKGEIDRREFGLKWTKGLKKTGELVVGNNVKLILEIEGIEVK